MDLLLEMVCAAATWLLNKKMICILMMKVTVVVSRGLQPLVIAGANKMVIYPQGTLLDITKTWVNFIYCAGSDSWQGRNAWCEQLFYSTLVQHQVVLWNFYRYNGRELLKITHSHHQCVNYEIGKTQWKPLICGIHSSGTGSSCNDYCWMHP